jgi:hypothetical protein
VQARLREQGIVLVGGGADEAPEVYKRLPDVLAAHGGTIRVKHTLRPLGVAMAGRDVHDPYKDRGAAQPAPQWFCTSVSCVTRRSLRARCGRRGVEARQIAGRGAQRPKGRRDNDRRAEHDDGQPGR